MCGIDYSYRPERYFWPMDMETQILTRVKGSLRRDYVKAMIQDGRVDEIPEDITREELCEDERRAVGRVHPWFMGGEYLPKLRKHEIEIARITLKSTTRDVACVYAKRGKNRIYYRVVDEYVGELDLLVEPTKRTSIKPLTLGSLVEFFIHGLGLMEILERNSCWGGWDIEETLDFFIGESEFYPEFHDALVEKVLQRFPPSEEEEEEEYDEYDEYDEDVDMNMDEEEERSGA
jgi:hypothetical protein